MRIKIKNVTKKIKNDTILENINISFESGKIYGLFGRNGSGKTVFLKLLCGFYAPSSGNILYNNIDINKKKIFPPNTRALIEKPNFLPTLSGMENLKLLASIQKKISEKEIEKYLTLFDLDSEKNKKYKNYSLGTKQKLGIIQALMENPEVIILDEPLNGIDNKTTIKIRNLLKSEKNNGKIIIIASHIKEDLYELADVLYEVDNKKIKQIKKKELNKKIFN